MREISTIKKYSQLIFFISLFVGVFVLFFNAFSIDFFLDDFFFLRVGHANNVFDFIKFFSPFKDYFYRPIPTEVFYYFINIINENLFISHFVVFLFYFAGLIFLYKSTFEITKKNMFSFLFTAMYAIHFTHVFQLYQLATFIEIALFTFLAASFYFLLAKKYVISIILFILALMSKETAVLFPFALVIYLFSTMQLKNKKSLFLIGSYFFLSLLFIIVYKYGTSHVVAIDIYKLQPSPQLIINNAVWYFLWSLGLPNFVPNYIKSIFLQPPPEFFDVLKSKEIRNYFSLLIIYYSLFISVACIYFLKTKKRKKDLLLLFFLFSCFILFISPTLPIVHRWMVRLTLPLIFITAFQAYILYKTYFRGYMLRVISIFLLLLYFTWNYSGVRIHESSGLFLLNSRIVKNVRTYFALHREEIMKRKIIYFAETTPSAWGGTKELKNILHGENFAYYFFPNQKITVIYAHEQSKIPPHAYVIESDDILKQ